MKIIFKKISDWWGKGVLAIYIHVHVFISSGCKTFVVRQRKIKNEIKRMLISGP